ncbi:MAG: S41 family peptidase, partial [Fidelibacterota bacterium]
ITNTPEQERNISFSHDGRKLLYASERNGSWNLYQSRIVSDNDIHFFSAGELAEDVVLADENEAFQPAYSPNDSLIAYLHERVEIRIIEPATGRSWTILPADKNYSYSDGDQNFEWSPDGKWIVSNFLPSSNRWVEDAALISIDGKTIVNITESGYYEWLPRWSNDGSLLYCFSNELGMRSHGSWGSQVDVFAFYTSDSTFDRSKLSKVEIEEEKAREEKQKSDAGKEDENKEDSESEDDKEITKPIRIETDGIRDRRVRLTAHSSNLSDARVTPDGEDLVYLARFENGYDLWKINLREKTPSIVSKLGARGAGSIQFDSTGTQVFILTNSGITKVDLESGEQKGVGFSAEMELNTPAEREYLFEHIWRQVKKKFYVTDLHGVDWVALKSEYARFLPHINNNRDFSELMSEMLGELNASHTGCYYRPDSGDKDHTYSLGLFLDDQNPAGLLITEIIKNGPADKYGLRINNGNIIEAIDGNPVTGRVNYFPLLNRLNDQKVRLSLLNPASGERWDEYINPISMGRLNGLLYDRWTESRRVLVDSLSNGTLGYVHVRGMSDGPFRKTYAEIFGRQVDKKALIVDTRFNGGGWLHDDLARLLSGEDYAWMLPRGQKVGKEPQDRWTKPVVVVMGEANYSDAHFFPYTFTALKIGKTVGMPVPGTATAVWWERLQDPSLVFGIPQVGILDMDGDFLENQQLEPDYKVKNDPGSIANGRDLQIEKAVQVLLDRVGQ